MGDRKNCGTECLQKGDPAGLVTKNNEFHILVVSSVKLAPYVGKQVRVAGTDFNGDIKVDKVKTEKDGKWEEVDLNATK